MNRMRENMSLRGGRGHGGSDQSSIVQSATRNRPGFPQFRSRHNRRRVRFIPEPRSNGWFQSVTTSRVYPWPWRPSSASGTRKRPSLPRPGRRLSGFEGVPGGMPGGLPTPNGRETPDRFHTRGPPPPGGNGNARFGGSGGGSGGFGSAARRRLLLVNRKENRAKGRRKREGERERKTRAA